MHVEAHLLKIEKLFRKEQYKVLFKSPDFKVCSSSILPWSLTNLIYSDLQDQLMVTLLSPNIPAYVTDVSTWMMVSVTDPSMTLTHKVGPGLQDLQKRGWRILAERNAKKAKENTWIGRMVVAESLEEMKMLIKSHDSIWVDQLSCPVPSQEWN